jgi:SAM-dependent methyltransferase
MSHKEQVDFFSKVYENHKEKLDNKEIIEIGSLIINGTLRTIFRSQHYIGVDLGQGPGVDIISRAHEVKFQDNTFDVALSAECFEHDEFWVQSFQKMIDLVKPKGMIVFSCATDGRAEHGTPRTDAGSSPFTPEYYRNLNEQDFREQFDFDDLFTEYEFSVEANHHDLYFWGILK